MNNKFFTFIRPYLTYIDNGHFFSKPFSWLYSLLAFLNLLIPVYVFYKAIDEGIFDDTKAKYAIVFLLFWVVLALACWIGFQLWWDRKSKINTSAAIGDEFIATPVFSHFIQTLGEWLGTFISIVGFGFALFSTIILGGETNDYSYNSIEDTIGIPYLQSGWLALIIAPVLGFLTIVITRFFAEQIRALSAIANNTKRQNNNIIVS